MSPSSYLLEGRSLRKEYDSGGEEPLVVLADLDLQVERGEMVAIVGESGTGKSTLLHLLGGLDRPTSGQVLFEGEEVFEKSDEELAAFRNRSVGFVFQFHHRLPEFTALENAAMPALVRQQSLADVRPRVMDLLETLGVGDRADHRPSELSGGERQRVAIARALVNEPGLVLLDEPTGNLDTRTAGTLHDELQRLNEIRETTFVIGTHHLALAARANRVLRLEDGTLHEEDREALADSFL